eukprot:m.232078 g.232078  ORF g.232078 m.232078 type:complete len:103 (+) comp22436_c12_seq4:735-1043(+)
MSTSVVVNCLDTMPASLQSLVNLTPSISAFPPVNPANAASIVVKFRLWILLLFYFLLLDFCQQQKVVAGVQLLRNLGLPHTNLVLKNMPRPENQPGEQQQQQ